MIGGFIKIWCKTGAFIGSGVLFGNMGSTFSRAPNNNNIIVDDVRQQNPQMYYSAILTKSIKYYFAWPLFFKHGFVDHDYKKMFMMNSSDFDLSNKCKSTFTKLKNGENPFNYNFTSKSNIL